MDRAIVGYHHDAVGDLVADLDCGHGQHVRHQPPFVLRPWTLTEDGRRSMLGTPLACVRCDRLEFPEGFATYKRTREFTHDTVPAGLRHHHTTAVGVWARIVVLDGQLAYQVEPPVDRRWILDTTHPGVVAPQIPHRVEVIAPVRCYVEFWKRATDPGPTDADG
jgi:tellurite methyltransferase